MSNMSSLYFNENRLDETISKVKYTFLYILYNGEQMKISAIKCKKCGDMIYSRAVHDFRSCSCGSISIDGGFDYNKVTFKNIDDFCNINLYLNITLRELYDDWNNNFDKYGLVKSK